MGRFADALRNPGLAAIAEVKRRSPSAGDLRPGADPASLASEFERAGAAAVSILVDERFGGSVDDLHAARSATRLPLLAKGFFSTRDQFTEARTAGADAVLLLLRDLDDAVARELTLAAEELGLDVLVEAHDEGEIERAVSLGVEVIGVNARDLSTFAVDRHAQLELIACLKRPCPGLKARDMVVVAESGIESRAQGAAAELAGADLAGFVLADSPRRAAEPLPVPDTMLSVGVFVGEADDLGTDLVQVYPEENGHRARDGVLLRDGEEVARVLDLPWLASDDGHWSRASEIAGRVLLAGGLGPENVGAAIRAVRPWCVDASRSLEVAPGLKDHARVRAFVEAAR